MGHANGRPEDNTDGACCWETRFESVVCPPIEDRQIAVCCTYFENRITSQGVMRGRHPCPLLC